MNKEEEIDKILRSLNDGVIATACYGMRVFSFIGDGTLSYDEMRKAKLIDKSGNAIDSSLTQALIAEEKRRVSEGAFFQTGLPAA